MHKGESEVHAFHFHLISTRTPSPRRAPQLQLIQNHPSSGSGSGSDLPCLPPFTAPGATFYVYLQ